MPPACLYKGWRETVGGASGNFPAPEKPFAKEVGNFPSQPGRKSKQEGEKSGAAGTKENFSASDDCRAQNENCEKAILPLVRKREGE